MAMSRKRTRYWFVMILLWMALYLVFSNIYIVVPQGPEGLDVVYSRLRKDRITLTDIIKFNSSNSSENKTEVNIDRILRAVIDKIMVQKNSRNKAAKKAEKKKRNRRILSDLNLANSEGYTLKTNTENKEINITREKEYASQELPGSNTVKQEPFHNENTENKEINITREKEYASQVLPGRIFTVKQEPFQNDPVKEKQKEVNNVIKEKTNYSNYYNYRDTVITPINADFLVTSEHVCKEVTPGLIILVLSSPHNILKRNAIRGTYGTLSRDKISEINGLSVTSVIRTVFLIGKSPDAKATNLLKSENSIHKDLILFDFIDTYYHLTKKVLHGFLWVSKFCPGVSDILKIDDDVFMNTAVLTQRLQKHTREENGTIFGHVYRGLGAVERTGKWAVSLNAFPFPDFPDYMSGTCYVISSNLIPKILYTAQRLPYLNIEDAFITGVISNRLLGAKLVNWDDNSYWNFVIPDPCIFVYGILSMTNVSPQLMNEIWLTLITNGTGANCIFRYKNRYM